MSICQFYERGIEGRKEGRESGKGSYIGGACSVPQKYIPIYIYIYIYAQTQI